MFCGINRYFGGLVSAVGAFVDGGGDGFLTGGTGFSLCVEFVDDEEEEDGCYGGECEQHGVWFLVWLWFSFSVSPQVLSS